MAARRDFFSSRAQAPPHLARALQRNHQPQLENSMFQIPSRILRLLPDRKRVTDPATDSDQRIAGRLQDLFERELAMSDIGGLQFFVHRGSVVLRGDNLLEGDRDAVRSLVKSVPEVRRVIDHLNETAKAA
jgi:hypothetical protein